jgi:hypothetical protein
MILHTNNEADILSMSQFPRSLEIADHLNGFDSKLNNQILNYINSIASPDTTLTSYYIFDQQVSQQYKNLNFKLSQHQTNSVYQSLIEYRAHPELNYKNFICCFNGSPHVSRKLLVSILQKFGYFSFDYCSKNFTYTADILDGHIHDYVHNTDNFFRKFFISGDSQDFFQSINSFGHVRFDHAQNIYNLESKLTESFLHIVSETMATSYAPFVSEKFLYSIVTRGLFLAYAQPGWHTHLEQYYGFKKYNKLFDYRFDSIQNPVERLVELTTMISKFSVLSLNDWKDLYQMEADTIEYNYDHYFSGDYLKHLKQYE